MMYYLLLGALSWEEDMPEYEGGAPNSYSMSIYDCGASKDLMGLELHRNNLPAIEMTVHRFITHLMYIGA